MDNAHERTHVLLMLHDLIHRKIIGCNDERIDRLHQGPAHRQGRLEAASSACYARRGSWVSANDTPWYR